MNQNSIKRARYGRVKGSRHDAKEHPRNGWRKLRAWYRNDTACAISTCISADLPASRPRQDFVRVSAMAMSQLAAGSDQSSDPIPSQARPTFDDILISDTTAHFRRRDSGFETVFIDKKKVE